MKVCTKCIQEKPATTEFFHHSSRVKCGLQPVCKDCSNARDLPRGRTYRAANSERTRQNGRNQYRNAGFRSKIKTSKRSAKRNGLEFTINEQDLINQFNKQQGLCHYTNLPMSPVGSNDWSVISVDRIDSNKGYSKDNIVLCQRIINVMKNDLTLDQFKAAVIELHNCFVTNANVGYTLAGT